MSEFDRLQHTFSENQARDVAVRASVAGKYGLSQVPSTYRDLWNALPVDALSAGRLKCHIELLGLNKANPGVAEAVCQIAIILIDNFTDEQGNTKTLLE